jgi:hypothetical protein
VAQFCLKTASFDGHPIGSPPSPEGEKMDAVVKGYKAVSLLVWLNADRLFSLGTVLVGLLAGAFLGSALLQP